METVIGRLRTASGHRRATEAPDGKRSPLG